MVKRSATLLLTVTEPKKVKVELRAKTTKGGELTGVEIKVDKDRYTTPSSLELLPEEYRFSAPKRVIQGGQTFLFER